MGWRGTLRTFSAITREAERDARRRQRELERQQKEFQRMQELQRAAHEVDVYKNKIQILETVHHDCSKPIDWDKIYKIPPPPKPKLKQINEQKAIRNYQNYKPTFFHKIFYQVNKRKKKLKAQIKNGKKQDISEYKLDVENYKEWAQNKKLSYHVLRGNTKAYEFVLKEIHPFQEIEMIGSSLTFDFINKDCVFVDLHVNNEEIIPKEIKSLLKSGKLSVKQMPNSKFYELYQDYVCSCTLRVANELFALLPIKIVIVNALGELLNTQTGYIEKQVILSISIPIDTIKKLNLRMIDPSDSMRNFIHNMNFKKTVGFHAVEKIDVNSIKY